jgi:enoyl-CoA hydratase/carnithine racemase
VHDEQYYTVSLNTMSDSVLTSINGAVGQITLNRPSAYNAITIELALTLEQSLRELAADADVNVIVVRGAGENFSVGGDFKELERLRADGEPALRELFESFSRACAAIAELPVPVVAAVEGYAMAGGFELMQACDLALVREDAVIADNHTNFGQVPGGGSSQRLPRLVGRQRALGLILTGDRLSGAEAAAWGLAYRAFSAAEFEAGVAEVARRLAAKSREALARVKRLVCDGLELPLADGLALELRNVLDHLAGASAADGIERFASRGAEGSQ